MLLHTSFALPSAQRVIAVFEQHVLLEHRVVLEHQDWQTLDHPGKKTEVMGSAIRLPSFALPSAQRVIAITEVMETEVIGGAILLCS